MMLFYNKVLQSIRDSIILFGSRNAFCINEEYYTYSQFGQCISKVRKQLTKFKYKLK